jgi:hypothetical protein
MENDHRPPFAPGSIDGLLYDLCVDLGFCLPPGGEARIRMNPPETIEAFADAVYLEEGLAGDKRKRLRQLVEERISKYFEAKSQIQ